ncbi:unnamed protein product [Paramecium octaurelia]|uniref:Uncharacterized protein n=1 Tax=Paramecium octaurelia TaxID=43137 RepID=A0A8S1WX89_PAROT|nr:unnamed protein product [Paramecium octaurelia]
MVLNDNLLGRDMDLFVRSTYVEQIQLNLSIYSQKEGNRFLGASVIDMLERKHYQCYLRHWQQSQQFELKYFVMQ